MDGRRRWLRSLAVLITLVCVFVPAGCRGGGSALDDVVRALAKSQGVDENTVRTALQGAASSEDEQLTLARQWETLPSRQLPDLNILLDDMARYGREQLKSATCEAVFDIARTGQVPSGQQFVTDYLTSLATGSLPESELVELVDTFDQLWEDAAAGDVTSFQLRLTLLKIQYC